MIPRLRPDALISVEYGDDTAFGGPISPKLGASLRRLCSAIYSTAQQAGLAHVVRQSEDLLAAWRQQADYLALLDPTDPSRIAPEVLYPDPRLVKPVGLSIV